jgi:hypothetical protein
MTSNAASTRSIDADSQNTSNFPVLRKLGLVIVAALLANGTFLFLPIERNEIWTDLVQMVKYGRSRGFASRVFVDTDGSRRPYMVFVPHRMKNKDRLPLLLYLNGHGENGNDGIVHLKNGLSQAIWENEVGFPFVVAWPQCAEGDLWCVDGPSSRRAVSILKQVAEEFHTDPDRVYISGISTGGAGAWSVAGNHKELFSAVIPASAANAEAMTLSDARIPVWSHILIEDPRERLVQSNIEAHEQLLDAGLSPHLTELSRNGDAGKGDHNSWSFAYRDGGLYRWLAARNRAERAQIESRFERVNSKLELSFNKDSVAPDAGFDPRAILQLTVSGDDSIGIAIARSQFTFRDIAELHLEFRADAKMNRFGIGLFPTQNRNSDPEDGVLIDLSINDLSSGGIYSWPRRDCLRPFWLVADHAFRDGGWNDLRLRMSNGSISAELNGWNLLDNTALATSNMDESISFVGSGPPESMIEIRNIRIRRYNQSELQGRATETSAPTVKTQQRLRQEDLSLIQISSIIEAWGKRERKYRNVEMSWTLGRDLRFATSLFQRAEPTEGSVLPTDIGRLVISVDSASYSTAWGHPRMDLTNKAGLKGEPGFKDFSQVVRSRFVPLSKHAPGNLRLEVFCDSHRRVDELFDTSNHGYRGIIFAHPNVWTDRIGEMDDLVWKAPMLAFRPLARYGFACQADSCNLLSKSAWIEGIRCAVIEETSQSDGIHFKRRFWVDPARDFLVLRSCLMRDGILLEQIDLQYDENSIQEWHPCSWIVIRKGSKSHSITSDKPFPGDEWLFDVISAKVTERSFANSSIAKSIPTNFRIGSIVYDQSANEWSQQVSTNGRRKLEPFEVTTLGSAIDDNSSLAIAAWSELQIGCCVVLLFATGWLIYRRRRR